MRLRNKKTGEIKSIEEIIRDAFLSNELDSLKSIDTNWEDVDVTNATNIPLIKDPKIRRAVRAWVEIGKYEHIYYDRAYNRLADDHDFVHCIEFAIDPCPDAESERCYTITELCGEEEKEEDLRDEEY